MFLFGKQEARKLAPLGSDVTLDHSYRIVPVIAPRLSGMNLKILTSTLENATGRATILPKLLKDNGFVAFNETHIVEPPTFLPLHIPPPPLSSSSPPPSSLPTPPQNVEKALELAQGRGRKNARHPTHSPSPDEQVTHKMHNIEDFAIAYREGKTSPLHVAKAILDAVETTSIRKLGIFREQNKQDILKMAEESTARYKQGNPISVLDGVPIAVKDEFHQRGYSTIGGTSFGLFPVQFEDATVVGNLRQCGAVLVGKTHMSEIGICPVGFQQHYGPPRNPYNPGHHTGGSSSGSACSVASGIVPAAVSADGGGSIRVPAAFCGMYGLKSTFGRLSEHGAAPLCPSLGHAGPIAATARDLVITYAAMQRPDLHDSNSLVQPFENFRFLGEGGIEGLKVAIDMRWAGDASPEIVDSLHGIKSELEMGGATVTEIQIPELEEIRCAHTLTILSEMLAAVAPQYSQSSKVFSYDTRIKLVLASQISSSEYVHAQKMRTRAMAHVSKIFKDFDVILTPSTAITAPKIDDSALPEGVNDLPVTAAAMRFAQLANFTGLPAISIPWSFDASGMPIGMQFHGRPWEESRLLQLALYLADARGERNLPSVYSTILQNAIKMAEEEQKQQQQQ